MTPTSDPNPSFALTINEAARDMRCSREMVVRLIHSGEMTAFKIGRTYRIERDELRRYAERNRPVE